MKEYLLGIDIGTASSKGVLIEAASGKPVAEVSIEHELSMPRAGWVEQDAETIWWDEFVQIVKDLLVHTTIPPSEIAGIGISGIGPCVLPVDADFKPLRPAILYGIDSRASAEIKQYEEALGPDEIFRRAGCELSSSSVGPKILWIYKNEPEIYQKTRWFMSSQNFIVARLTGRAVIDIYTASTYSPIIDVEKSEWLDEEVAGINPFDKLPEKVWSTDIVGKVTAEAAKITGLAEGTPVVAGAIDAAAEAVSIGNVAVGETMAMFASSNSIIALTDVFTRSRTFWGLNWLFPGQYALVGGMATVGSLTKWFLDNIYRPDPDSQEDNPYAQMSRLLEKSKPGANNLLALPYFEGERTPIYDPNAKGAFFGLTLRHSQADLYRAMLEGVGFGIRHNLEALAEEGVAVNRINAVGGATQNLGWMQIIADIAEVEVRIMQGYSGAAFGAAILAGIGVGIYKDASQAKNWEQAAISLKPNPDNAETYRRLYPAFRRLYEDTKGIFRD